MLHAVYLASLCTRRHWSEPRYYVSIEPRGYRCVVRVNNREYQTSGVHGSESSAKEEAALIAFNICRSFSANDGMYPTGFAHGGVIQGNPVPVGSGRHGRHASTVSYSESSSGSRSGGSSPEYGDKRQHEPARISPRHQSTYSSSLRHEPRYNRHESVRY